MNDKLFDELQKLFESNKRRFDAPIMESYSQFDELDVPKIEPEKPEVAKVTPGHSSLYPQPKEAEGILYINPKAIPNDYSEGHVVCVLIPDKDPTKVRKDSFKNGAVRIPFSLIKQDEEGKEYVTKEDILAHYKPYVYKLLKQQPESLDRFRNVSNRGIPDDTHMRKQALNPNVQDPSGELKGDKRAKDNLRRYVAHRVAGDRGEEEPMHPKAAMLQYPKDLETGVTSAQKAKDTANSPEPGTPAYYEYINNMRKEKGLPPIPQSQWKLKK